MQPRKNIEHILHDPYQVDYYGYYSTGASANLAVIILNRNLPEETDRLCDSIIGATQIPFDLFVVESGSDPDRLSRYCSLHFVDPYARTIGLRIGRGLNNSLRIINKIRNRIYDGYWFLTNDVVLTTHEDYGSFSLSVFAQYPHIGIIESPHLVNEFYTLNYFQGQTYRRRLNSASDYPPAIQEKKFSITPFGIVRSIFLRSDLVRSLDPIIDESNWRGWGCDEDLGYRAWQKGWWSATTPYHGIREDTFLTTRRNLETRTEHVDQFRLNAEIDMKEFLYRKYKTDLLGLRRMIYKKMLGHITDFDDLQIAIAHGYPGSARVISDYIKQANS